MSSSTRDFQHLPQHQPVELVEPTLQALFKRLHDLQVGPELMEQVMGSINVLVTMIKDQHALLQKGTGELTKERAELERKLAERTKELAELMEKQARMEEDLTRLERVQKERGLYIAESQKRWAAEKQALQELLSCLQAQIDEPNEGAGHVKEDVSRRLA